MKKIIYVIMTITSLALLGCKQDEPAPSPDIAVVTNDVNPQNGSTDTRIVYLSQTDRRMKALDAKIDELSAKEAALDGDARADADKALAELRSQRDAARRKYDDLKQATGDAWEKAKAGFADAWDGVERDYDKVKAKFD